MRSLPDIDPPTRLWVCDVAHLQPAERLAYIALQGIANRGRARVYLLFSQDPSAPDHFWLDFYKQEFGVTETRIAAEALFEELRVEINGYAVCDPRLGSTANLAMTLAGLEGVVPASPRQIPLLERLGIPKRHDFRGGVCHRLAAYDWGIRNLLPKCSTKIVGHSRTVFANERSADIGGEQIDTSGRDLIVAARGFLFDVGHHGERTFPGSDEEEAIVARIYSHLEPLAVVLGWMYWWEDRPLPWEIDYVRRNTLAGLNTVCGGAPNLTVHCAIRPTGPLVQGQADPATLPLEKKVYVTFGVSDGDALWCIHGRWSGEWDDPARGAVPLGWTLNPMVVEYAPGIYQYLLQARTPNDCFVSCSTGASYVEASNFPYLQRLAEHTDYYHGLSDIRVIMGFNDVADDADPYGDFGTIRTGKIPVYLQHPNVLGVAEGYGPRYSPDRSWDEQNYFAHGKPWVTNIYEDDFTWFEKVSVEKVVKGLQKIAAKEQTRPLFLPVFLGIPHGIRYSSFVEIAAQLDPDQFQVLRPDTFMLALARAKEGGLVRGTDVTT